MSKLPNFNSDVVSKVQILCSSSLLSGVCRVCVVATGGGNERSLETVNLMDLRALTALFERCPLSVAVHVRLERVYCLLSLLVQRVVGLLRAQVEFG